MKSVLGADSSADEVLLTPFRRLHAASGPGPHRILLNDSIKPEKKGSRKRDVHSEAAKTQQSKPKFVAWPRVGDCAKGAIVSIVLRDITSYILCATFFQAGINAWIKRK